MVMLFQGFLCPAGSPSGSPKSSLLLFKLRNSYASSEDEKRLIPFLFAFGFCTVEVCSAVSPSVCLLTPLILHLVFFSLTVSVLSAFPA